jgi:hypothetical protein
MAASIPVGVQFMEVTIEGKLVVMKYGGKEMKNLVEEFGKEVLRIPEQCITMRNYQKNLLHVESSWVRGPSYPFLTLSMSSKIAVIPFEVQQSGLFKDLVFIIPGGFTTTTFLLEWKKTLAKTTRKGSCFHLEFEDCRHQLVRGLDEDNLIEIVSFLLDTSTPVIVTLTANYY